MIKSEWLKGFPGSSVIKKFTCQCRRHRFNLCSRKIPYAVKQPSLWATTTEPVLYSPETATIKPTCCNSWRPGGPRNRGPQQGKPLQWQARTSQQSRPSLPYLEKSPHSSPAWPKINKYIFKWIAGTSLVVQWLRLHALSAGILGLTPGQGTRSHMPQLKISHATMNI